MAHHNSQWIGDWMACMADAAVEVAEGLDAFNRLEAEKFASAAARSGLTEMPEFFNQLAPSRIHFRQHRFEAEMELTIRHERSAEVGVFLFGRPITQLYYARFADETTTFDRLTVDIEAVPRPNQPR